MTTDGKFKNIPTGYKATLIAFTMHEEKTYFSAKEIVIDEEMVLKINFEEVSLEKIKEKIKTMTE